MLFHCFFFNFIPLFFSQYLLVAVHLAGQLSIVIDMDTDVHYAGRRTRTGCVSIRRCSQ